ncbi:hypothetical protein [Oricola thermophila]|uniref:DUF4148 domain-containing protein n=1 Tax=Oricola thermophila TaxID=2742145 RepID=A0A6N1VD03_9HYPH|nr:hypothetical protein [Oricola thermophila]QKV18588.1 hypothetical protein HTY61_09060 [Oricola thermophila]
MNALISSFAAGAVAVLALSGAAEAGAFSAASAIQSVGEGDYVVRRIDTVEAVDEYKADAIRRSAAANADAVQQAVRANPTLVNGLAGQNVQVDNIVEADETANGKVIFYLR